MAYEYKNEDFITDLADGYSDEIFNEVKELYMKAKKLDKIIELTDVPINIKQDRTMIEINKILNE